jgi:hypothetical protein
MIGMLVLYGVDGTVAAAATLVYHAISLWVPAIWGTVAFIVLQKTKKQPITLRNPTEELHPRSAERRAPGRRGRKSPPSGEDSSPEAGRS